MAPFAGRNLELEWATESIAGVREKGLSLNGEPINVTSDEDNGRRMLLGVSAEDEVNITLSGVTKSNVLKAAWFGNDRTETVTITYPNGDVVEGQFFLASYTDNGPYNDASTFDAELRSTGEVTFTPGAS